MAVVVDGGGANLRFGFASEDQPSGVVPNQVVRPKRDRRTYVADEIDQCRDISGLYLRRPFEKGYLVDFELQKEIWDRAFGKHYLKIQPKDHDLVLTQPLFTPLALQEATLELVFEEYGFKSLFCCSPATAVMHYYRKQPESMHMLGKCPPLPADAPSAAVVVDNGYSFTHVVPFFEGERLHNAVKRINVGGKVLTNHLKEIISFRTWNMMEETFLVNIVKERMCYVSLDFIEDMHETKRPNNRIVQKYLLPDYTTTDRGHVLSEDEANQRQAARKAESAAATAEKDQMALDEQVLVMNNERIAVPEILFHPSDIGVPQAGVAETIAQSIACAPRELQSWLYANIVLTGGNTLFPNYPQRLYTELRKLAPTDYPVRVFYPKDPISAAWRGAALMAQDPLVGEQHRITKEQYKEMGSPASARHFQRW